MNVYSFENFSKQGKNICVLYDNIGTRIKTIVTNREISAVKIAKIWIIENFKLQGLKFSTLQIDKFFHKKKAVSKAKFDSKNDRIQGMKLKRTSQILPIFSELIGQNVSVIDEKFSVTYIHKPTRKEKVLTPTKINPKEIPTV
jgi:hypothetical protein